MYSFEDSPYPPRVSLLRAGFGGSWRDSYTYPSLTPYALTTYDINDIVLRPYDISPHAACHLSTGFLFPFSRCLVTRIRPASASTSMMGSNSSPERLRPNRSRISVLVIPSSHAFSSSRTLSASPIASP